MSLANPSGEEDGNLVVQMVSTVTGLEEGGGGGGRVSTLWGNPTGRRPSSFKKLFQSSVETKF